MKRKVMVDPSSGEVMAHQIVTAWFRDVGQGLKFNHISDGFEPEKTDAPEPKVAEQRKIWRNGVWLGLEAHLTDDVPPKLVIPALKSEG